MDILVEMIPGFVLMGVTGWLLWSAIKNGERY